MANWNLSVDLRATGNTLSKELRTSARHARTLATNAASARLEVRGLGEDSLTASRHIRTLGREARTAARGVGRLNSAANTGSRHLTRYGSAAHNADRHINSLGGHSRTVGRDLGRMSGQIDSAVRDLLRLASAARAADTRLGRVGGHGALAMRRYASETGRVRGQLRSMAGLLSGGALVMGGAELIKEGNEYQQAMNSFGAVTDATRMQMARAGATASQLGNDLSLPGATATDAAEAMVELAKAGFRTDQSISATRASLTLASAAQVSAADSAKYLGDMMDQFGMGADQASVAADTLAATANAASGDITDIYYAMKYAGPIAHGLGVTMQEAAAGVGMLGKAGILGQTAGTTLRGMFTNMAKPTKQMSQGLKTLGIDAYDTQGNFKGLRYVVDGLAKAQHSLNQQDFTAAVAKAFGKPAMSGAIALAHQGTASYDALIKAVSGTGAAADIAAAKGKGLAGAMLQLKTQSKQTGLAIYNGLAPGLEWFTRGITSGLSKATPHIEHFFQYFNDAATLFGPGIAGAARKQFEDIGNAASGMLKPLKNFGGDAAATGLHALLTVGQMVVDVLGNLVDGATPVVQAMGDVAGGSDGVSTSLDLVVTVLDAAATAVSFLSGVLGPVGHLVGSLVHDFGALPGPVQSAVLAMLLMRRVGPMAQGVAGSVGGRLTGAYRSLNQQMTVQRTLAAASGVSIGRYGAAFAVLQTRVPIIGRMGASFRTASAQASGFGGVLRGIGAAGAVAGRSLGSGLMGALGGPWGLAITAATVGLGFLAKRQQQAAQAAAEHEANIRNLAQALRESKGAIDDNVRTTAAQTLQDAKIVGGKTSLIDVTKRAGIGLRQLTDAYLGQGDSLKSLQDRLYKVAEAHTGYITNGRTTSKVYDAQGKAAKQAADALGAMSGDMGKAVTKAKDLAAAAEGTADSASAYDKLKDAVGALADKTGDADSRTRALRDALDLLSGGSISLQAAQARVNEAITNANEAMASGIDKTAGWGKQLVKASGALDTTTKNGQALFSTLDSVAQSSSQAALAAYDFAQSQGKDVPTSVAAARKEMEKARASAIKLATGYGLNAEQAGKVATAMGLIPGQVSILLSVSPKGLDGALAELLAVQAEFARLPKAKTIKVDALGADAKKELEDIGYKIQLIPGTREYKITAPTAAARHDLDLLVAKLAQTNGKNIPIKAPSAGAIRELTAVQKKVAATKGKTLTMRAPTTEAQLNLQALGFSIKRNAKNKTVTISVPTGDATYNARIIQNAIDNIHGKSIGIGVRLSATSSDRDANGVPDMIQAAQARGSVLDFYADGGTNRRGIRENHTAQIAPAGAWRVWAEEETGGEAYIPLASSKRGRSRAITEETIRRLGGDPKSVQWHADGAVVAFDTGGFSYTPTGVRRDTSYVQSAYSDAHQPIDKDEYNKKIRAQKNAVDSLRAAEAALAQLRRRKHTHSQTVAAEARVAKARRTVATATDAARTAEARYKKQFSLSDWNKTLKSAVSANASWEANLNKIAARGGSDVIDQLRDMGEEGAAMVAALAKASKSQFNSIVANLRKLGPLAKASLADYTKQLNASNKTSTAFQANLAKLAAMGYGDLATQLAGQGDEAAQKLAAEAVKSSSKASAADKAAKTSAKELSGEELAELIQIIAAVKTSTTGLHAVAGSTGLEEDEIITVANKATAQIKSSLGGRSAQFLADLARANKGLSYANGGIREGIYSTRGGAVTFAEPSTGGEAYIPLGPDKRAAATRVLQDVVGRFGLGLTDMAATRPVIVQSAGDTTHVNVTAVRTGATASDIGSQVGRSVRRARRGGVAARAA